DKAVKFLSTTTGRDRVNRFVQYVTRFLIWFLAARGASHELLASLKNLMATIGLTRKVLFTGRQLEFYLAAVKLLATKDVFVKWTAIAKNFFMIVWVTLDTCQWLNATSLYSFPSIASINVRANQSWLAYILFSILGNLHKLRLNARQTRLNGGVPLRTLQEERKRLLRATVQDCLDVVLPVAMLEYVQLESGYLGIIGAVTSLMGACEYFFI
ncbi:peroxisomal biogenesis factor 11, partial [Chytriomyces sp. MP71]